MLPGRKTLLEQTDPRECAHSAVSASLRQAARPSLSAHEEDRL